MTAETWATWGIPTAESADPLRVSANTAGISKTASVRHPVFDTAFGGATAFGIETYAPATTRSLNGLLTIRDVVDPDGPASPSHEFPDGAARASAVTTHFPTRSMLRSALRPRSVLCEIPGASPRSCDVVDRC